MPTFCVREKFECEVSIVHKDACLHVVATPGSETAIIFFCKIVMSSFIKLGKTVVSMCFWKRGPIKKQNVCRPLDIQNVTGGMCGTSGECSLGQTIPI